ncbi:MAG: UbiA family prenyltransferase [Anaerolineaceae bacterium]|nr:UbiA family prenyltransferase [Anaerolineaceae bacterium]
MKDANETWRIEVMNGYNNLMSGSKIKAIIRLFRPDLSMAAGVCVVAGQILTIGKFPPFLTVAAGFLCAFFISASAIILNDYFDYEVDLVNAPDRPLPSGLVSKREAIWLTAMTSLLGLASALYFGLVVMGWAIVLWVIGILYNWPFKESGLPGNLMVCLSVASTFLLGGISVGKFWNGIIWVFASMAFFIDLGEEIAGDAMDMEGDRKRGSQSIALKKGRHFATVLSVICWIVVILLGFIPLIQGWFGWSYLVFITVTDLLMILFSVRLLRSKTSGEGRNAMRGVYIGATLAVVAFVLGQLIK